MTDEHAEDHARASVEHLQAAAREMIRATRSLLDAAEELVDDPSAVQNLVGTIASVAQAAASRLRTTPSHSGSGPDDGDDGDDGQVQRIRVS